MRGPSVLARLFAIPAVLRLIATAVQSMTLRQLAGLAVRDPAAFLRAVASPGTARVLIAQASRDPRCGRPPERRCSSRRCGTRCSARRRSGERGD